MSNKVVHFKSIGTVTFSPNRRAKNIKISVKPDKTVRVSFPFFVSAKEVTIFLLKNEEWITKQQEKFEKLQSGFSEGQEVKTRMFHVIFHKHGKTFRKVSGNRINIFVEDFKGDVSKAFITDTFAEIYRFEARRILPERLHKLAKIHGFTFNKITIRNNKRNWGSCSSKNNISLNLQMMKLPDELIDYILLHELVHTKIKNHGPFFWEALDKCTNYRARELSREVKKYSTY